MGFMAVLEWRVWLIALSRILREWSSFFPFPFPSLSLALVVLFYVAGCLERGIWEQAGEDGRVGGGVRGGGQVKRKE
jgi:hypothetical protein